MRDVLDWARVRGELEPSWRNFAQALECHRRATDEELETDDSAIDSAAIGFRYQHDLITAEETEGWLGNRGLTLTEFGEYFVRQYWARTFSGQVNSSYHSYSSAQTEEKDLFLIDLTLSGELDRLAEQLSFRVAAQAAEEKTEEDVATEREQFIAREQIEDMADWLKQFGRDQHWLDAMIAAERVYQRQLTAQISSRALERELLSMRLNLTRFELEVIEVDSRDAAAEVIACVRSDGMDMSEIADESRYPFRRSEILLEDLPLEQQQSFLSVKAGALLEPIAREDAFEVCRIKSRADPQLSDTDVRKRLEERLSSRHFSELVGRHIKWKVLQPTPE